MEETQEKIVAFLSANAKPIAAVVAVIVLVAGGYGILNAIKTSKEKSAQEVFGSVERNYNELRQNFLQANQPPPPPPPKTPGAPEPTPPPVLAKASGDLTQDYGSVVEGFEKVLNNHSGTQAAKMSALYLSGIFSDYKKLPEAQKALESADSKSKDLLSFLVKHRLASVIADQGNCPEARSQWQSILEVSPDYLKDEMKMRVAGCFEQEGELDRAKALYVELSQKSEGNEASVAKDAEKYLRALNFKAPAPTQAIQ